MIQTNSGIWITDLDGVAKCAYKPTDKQLEYHQCVAPNALFWGGRGSGKSICGRWDAHLRALSHPGFTYVILRRTYPELQKALALDTPIPTPTGFTSMGELQVGDTIFALDGTPTTVLHKSIPSIDQHGTYKLTFDDGETIIASAGHKWHTLTAKERSAESRQRRGKIQHARTADPQGSVRTTQEIATTLYAEGGVRSNHAIRLGSAWQIAPKDLPIDPYVLGVWLGDGSSSQGIITSNDTEIIDYIRSAGYEVTKHTSKFGYGVLGLAAQLRDNQLLHNKHIPTQYLFASFDQRLALLQGLMDTDGHCRMEGLSTFTNTDARRSLAEGVFILAVSLGLKPRWSAQDILIKKTGRISKAYTVQWTSSEPVFRLPRKLVRLPKTLRSSQRFRYIVKCEQIEDTFCQCIQVDHPSHQFLVGRASIPTHNSHLVHIGREMKMLGGTFHHTDRVAHYPNGSRGFFSHCATDDDVLNLLSAEFALMIFDELSTFEWDMFVKLSASVRVPIDSGLIAMVRGLTNPLGPSAQKVMQYFVTKDVDLEEDPDYVAEDWQAIKANLSDNPHIDQTQYKKRFAGLPAHVRKAWLDGDFVLENSLFDFTPTKDGKPYHVLPSINIEDLVAKARIYRVYDHGWFPDPAYCAWIAHLGNRYIVFHEKTWYKTIVADIATSIKEEDKLLGIDRIYSTYCDPSIDIHTGAEIRTIKDIFESNGVPMECSINKRELFASAVHTALNEEAFPGIPRLQIYCDGKRGAPYLVKALPMQRYNPKNPLALADHKDDHPVVSLAYFLISLGSSEQRTYTERAVKPWLRPRTTAKPFVLGNDSVR